MKTTFYEILAEDLKQRDPSVPAIRTRTLARVDSERVGQRPARPIRRALLAAAAAAVLVGGAIAAPAIYSAVKRAELTQSARATVLITEDGIATREGCLEVTLDVVVNEHAPEQIEAWYLPAQAADWAPEPLYYTSPEAPDFSENFFGAWTRPDGGRVALRQFTMTHYSPEVSFDTVSLGYGDAYELCTLELGDTVVQCVAVPPSQITAENGITVADSGRQKLYWSDGDYLFILEVPFETTEAELASLVESMMPVEDVTPYVQPVRQVDAQEETPSARPALEKLLFPTEVPAGWTLLEGSGPEDESNCTWIWTTEDQLSGLELAQTTDENAYESILMSWLGSKENVEQREARVGNLQLTVFETDRACGLLWQDGNTTYYLVSKGEHRLSCEALLKLVDSLAPLR